MVYFRIKHTIFMLPQEQPRQWGWLLHTLFTQHATSLLLLKLLKLLKGEKTLHNRPYATFINFLLKVVIKNQLFQCFFYLCDTLRINNMDKSLYISININNMGG